MAALTTLNITEKNANNSLSVTVKVNVTKEGVFTTTLSKEDVDKIHSYKIKLPVNRLGNEGYFNSTSLFFDLSRDEIVALTDEEISLYIDKELVGKGIPIEAKNWNIKNEKEVVYPRTGVPVFMLKDVGIGFRTIEGATEVANLLVKYNAFKTESRYLAGSYEQFWIMKEGVCPAVKGETGYSKEEFDKIDEKNKNPELTSINTFNDTVKKANEIKDRVLKYVYNIKQERSYNNDLVGIFERYKDIADGDMEVAMNFIKEAYPFNEETESFIRKKFDMPIPDESKEQ